MASVAAQIQTWVWLLEENAQLKQERERLLQWQAVARRLEWENRNLRQLLNFVPDPQSRAVGARVVANASNAFAHSVVVNAGTSDGVDRGHVVVTGEGLAGRVVAVSPRSALVLLTTDLNSRVPVLVGAERVRAILAGDNSEQPRLTHLLQDGAIREGDTVVTSGLAGGFPPGLMVGVVADAGGPTLRVQPFVDRSRLEFVRVIDYQLPPTPALTAAKPGTIGAAPSGGGQSATSRP
jgi:rod shape-determining protein MreC